MAPVRFPWPPGRLFLPAVMAVALLAPSAHALRILDYNILNYPGTTGPARDPSFRQIIAPIAPDLIVTEETTSQAGVTEFLNSLNVMEPGQWAALPFIDGNDTDAALFYKPSKFTALGQWAFYPDPTTNLRYVHVFRVRPAGYTSAATEIRFYALHLKASKGSQCTPIDCETRRLNECIGLRDSMNAMPPGTHAFTLGDFNFYTGTEPGLAKLLESQADNDGRVYDPLGFQGIAWQDNGAIALYHTQSPCKDGTCANGAATGGLDDRFDLILPTLNWNDSQGYELVSGSYVSVGNDGLHLNLNITDPPTIPEGATYATALKAVSDHLPLRVDIKVPAKIAASTTPIAFGTVIVGATPPSRILAISNGAVPPADALDVSFAATGGFTVPGPASVLPDGILNAGLQMPTATAGANSGTLTVTSDDPDQPTLQVGLSGTVLDHAQASLDSTADLTAGTLDFGERAAGEFPDTLVRVHDRGYGPLRAQLSVGAASITGGNGRFSIVGGFSPVLVGGVGATFNIHFDDAGATLDSTYTADLTFSSLSDEPLPGATSLPDLQVALSARVSSGGGVAVGDEPPPQFSRLYAPTPNPLTARSIVRFDLAHATRARLEVFDPGGRRVATLARRDFEPGRYSVRWDARDDAGARVAAGLYFVRLSGTGLPARTQRLVVVR